MLSDNTGGWDLAVITVIVVVGLSIPAAAAASAGTGDLSISVDDESGSGASDVTVFLYDSDWNYLEEATTDTYGSVYFSGHEDGEYRYEAYDDGVFWGGGSASISAGSTSYESLTRYEPYNSQVELTDQGDGDGTYVVGEPINISPAVANDAEVDRDVKVKIIVDTDDGVAEESVTRGPLTIQSGSSSWYGFDYVPETAGSKRVRIEVKSLIGGSYTTTDDTGWTQSFTVESDTGRIEGQITDSSGDPIDGARVYLDDATDTRTDSNGNYAFTDVHPSQHSLYVTAGSCYENPETTVDVTSAETTTQDFSLSSQQYSVDLGSEPVTADVDGVGTYECGTDVSVSAPPTVNGYEFDAWRTPGGDLYSEDRSLTISYLTSDQDLVAHYSSAGQPDMVVSAIEPSPQSPQEGDSVSFDVTVANRGDARAGDVNVELSIGGEIHRRTSIDFAAGQTRTIAVGDAWTATGQSGEATAEVDYSDQVDETDESNNERTTTVTVDTVTGTPTTTPPATTEPPTQLPAIVDDPPKDLDGDGIFEDLNGNNRLDFDDVVTLCQHRNEAVVTDHASAYDLNGDGRVDLNDCERLLEEV